MDDLFLPVCWPNSAPSPLLLGTRITWCKGTSSKQPQLEAAISERFGPARHVITGHYAWLVPNKTNPVDRNAVEVYIGQHHVGFVAAPLAAVLSPMLPIFSEAVWRGSMDGRVSPVSCMMTAKRVPEGPWIVGLVGPWPEEHSKDLHGARATGGSRAAGDNVGERSAGGGAAWWKHRRTAIDRMKRGMSLDDLVACVGEKPGKTEERVTKTCTRHVLHFVEDPMKDGRYLLKVTLEDGVVVSWAGEKED